MNHQNPLFFFFTVLIMVITGCNPNESPPALPDTNDTTNIIPLFTSSNPEPASRNNSNEDDYQPLLKEDLNPKVPILENETLLKVINVNLDLDRQEEQILILKDKENIDSLIHIAVLDYEGVIKDYRRTWVGQTGIANIRSFNISLLDLVGDHNIEIICAGVSLDNQQSLTVFRKTKRENDTGLFYSTIFDLKANGTIEILEVPRSTSYESGMRDGKSFPIISTIENPDSNNVMDLIKNTYFWDFPSRRYIKVKEEKILGTHVEEERMRILLQGNESIFEEHIRGPWFLNSDPKFLVDFNIKDGKVTFFSGDIQEVYNLKNSYKILGNLLRIGGENELINHVENEIYVKLVDLNTLGLTVRDIDTQTRIKTPNEVWSGQYFRYTGGLSQNDAIREAQGDHPDLFGKYLGDAGESISFQGNRFTFISENESYNGGISLFHAGVPIINLRILNASGISRENRLYRYDFSTSNLGNTIQRVLTLYPGKMGIYGFEEFPDDFIRFQQIEIVEEESTG